MEELIFQILSWKEYDECEEVDISEDENENKKKDSEGNPKTRIDKTYTIRIYGKTKDDKSICVKVENFNPFFYIKIDNKIRKEKIEEIIEEVQKKLYPKENVDGFLKYDIVEKLTFDEFNNFENQRFAKLSFKSLSSMKSYVNGFDKDIFIEKKKYKLPLFESNIDPYIRYMHIQDVESVGWASLKKYSKNSKETSCNINIKINYKDLHPYKENIIQKFTIAAFDIECTSEDGSFPNAKRDGDKIIQIGTTFSRFGSRDCFFKHIITLGDCDPIEDVEVESYDNEKDVLLAWAKMIRSMDPDIITGYNIFGFDFSYMKSRAKLLGIEDKFAKTSRVIGQQADFEKKKLASSALGDNLLKYYDMEGRIVLDIMGVVKREYKLSGYSLDFVSSTIIREEIKGIKYDKDNNQTKLITNSVGAVVDDYISIYYTDGVIEEIYKNEKISDLNEKSDDDETDNELDEEFDNELDEEEKEKNKKKYEKKKKNLKLLKLIRKL